MASNEAKSRRTPSDVPNIDVLSWEQARPVLKRFLKQLQNNYEGLPAKHAKTHKGGNDDVSGTVDPSPITLGASGDVGDAQQGFAPIDHIHDTSALDTLAVLDDAGGDTINGYSVLNTYNPTMVSLLQSILFKLEEIEKALNG